MRVLNYSGSGIETTFTQGEDACLAALVPELPRAPADAPPSLLVAGALADVVEDQFRRLFEQLGIAPVHFLPPRRSGDLPPSARTRMSCWPSRSLATRRGRWKSAAPTILCAPFPLGAEGTTAWLRAAADAWHVDAPPLRGGRAAGRERAPARRSSRIAFRLAGKRIFFFPDSQMEVPLARFLSRELACSPSKSARPICTSSISPPSSRLLPEDVLISEGQHVDRQLDRCRAAAPDIVVCGLGLANPLEAEGLTTKWSIELLFTPIQGYEQAGDLAELFARPLVRRSRLEV